jgi:hypothetical protein
LKRQIKSSKEKFQQFCSQVNEPSSIQHFKKIASGFTRFVGLADLDVKSWADCSSNYQATPAMTTKLGWLVDESK